MTRILETLAAALLLWLDRGSLAQLAGLVPLLLASPDRDPEPVGLARLRGATLQRWRMSHNSFAAQRALSLRGRERDLARSQRCAQREQRLATGATLCVDTPGPLPPSSDHEVIVKE